MMIIVIDNLCDNPISLLLLAFAIKVHAVATWRLDYWRKVSILLPLTSSLLTIFQRSCALAGEGVLASLILHLLF
mgnify:CR=1 FL=1